MSDIFSFNGSQNAGWSQPEPILSDSEILDTIPKSMLRDNPPNWAMHMSLLGPDGITVLAKRIAASTETARKAVSSIDGVELLHPKSSNFREFAVRVPGDSEAAISFMDSKGVIAGQPLGSWWDSYSSCILIGCDERTSSEDISALVTVIEEWIKEVSN